MKIVGNKMYEVCASCGQIVCVNKTPFGGLHVCSTQEERQHHAAEIAELYRINKFRLDEA